MKKTIKLTAIILSLIIAFSSIPLINAAEEGTKALWSYSFEDGEKGEWKLIDYDKDGKNWRVGSKEKDSVSAYDGDKSLYSVSSGVNTDNMNNIAISDSIDLNISSAQNVKFTWHVGTTDSYFDLEHYCLYIFKGDCEDSFIAEAVSSDEDEIFDNDEKVVGRRIKSETLNLNTTHYQDRSYDMDGLLSEFSDGDDKSIRIAFRHHDGQNQSAIKIDALKIEASYDFDEEYSYNFDGDEQGWIAIDGNGDTYNWERRTIDGEACFISESFAGGKEIEPLNYLVSPPITVESNMFVPRLEWDIGAADQTFCKENYSVYIYEGADTLNADNIKSKLTNAVHTETLQDDDYVHRTLFLDDSCSGKTIRIIFVHHDCEGQYYIKLDNISLSAVKKAEYTATFDADGGKFEDGKTEITVTATSGAAIVAPDSVPSKENFVFMGWEGYTDGMKMPAENVTFKAVWAPQYKLNVYEMDTNGEYPETPTKTIIFKDGVAGKTREIGYTAPEGFAINEKQSALESKKIDADGSTVFEVYLDRNEYTFTVDVDGDVTETGYLYGAAVAAPAEPSKEGHTFAGWDAEVPATMPAKDVTVKATWTVNNYTVTWVVPGQADKVDTVAYGAGITAPVPTKTGYVFAGWDAEIPATMPAENLTFTGSWNAATDTKYTVNIHTMNTAGTYDVATEVLEGTTEETVKAVYTVEEGFELGANSVTEGVVAADGSLVLDVYLNRKTVTISFNTDGGTAVDALTGLYGATVGTPAETTKTGYTFAGWNPAVPATFPAADTSVTAQWTADKIVAVYYMDDDGEQQLLAPTEAECGSEVKLPSIPTKEGYTLLCWKYKNGEIVNWPITLGEESVYVYASWVPKTYSVTFKDGDTIIKEGDQTYGETIVAPTAPEKIGYTFDGWFDAEGNTMPETVPAIDKQVYHARYTANIYKATFDANGGVFAEGVNNVYEGIYESTIVVPEAPTKEGCTFDGWAWTNSEGETIEAPETMPEYNVTATATWKDIETEVNSVNAVEAFSISEFNEESQTHGKAAVFSADGGKWEDGVTEGKVVYPTETAVYYAPGIPTKAGNAISGWVIDDSASDAITITVQWETVYTATFMVDGEVYGEVLSYVTGETIVAPAAPNKPGHSFKGWDPEVGTMGEESLTFTAQYSEHIYTSTVTTPATCTEKGVMTWTCECGDWYAEEISALGHSVGEWETTVNASCIAVGEKVKKCTVCDIVLETEEIAKTDHIEGEWEVVTNSSCTAVGEKVKKCTVCGIVLKIEKIAMTEHIAGEWEVAKNSTCTAVGEKVKKCTVCGIVCETEEIAMTKHIAGEWETILKPTTETEGKKVKKCTACGTAVAEEAIAKLPKEPVKDNAVIKSPSRTSISYGDSIVLHVEASKIPEGGRVEWTADNGNFSYKADKANSTCTISPAKSGDTTFTATIYDADGNPILKDEQKMTSKAGFFDKIIAFFKGLFKMNKTYPSIFNF